MIITDNHFWKTNTSRAQRNNTGKKFIIIKASTFMHILMDTKIIIGSSINVLKEIVVQIKI